MHIKACSSAKVQRRMSASTGCLWALHADFPNLASHWSGLRATSAIGDQTSGVGARRRVELKPMGSMDVTVTIREEGRRIDTRFQPSKVLDPRGGTPLRAHGAKPGISARSGFRLRKHNRSAGDF